MMRTSDQIFKMKKNLGKAVQVDSFLSNEEIQRLIQEFDSAENKEHKKTGPICSYFKADTIFEQKIHSLVGPCKILSNSLFFKTSVPHILHMDAPKDLGRTPYKAILLPLKIEAELPLQPMDLSFFLFEQWWFGEPAKFFKGEQDIYSPHNLPIYDYKNIEGLNHGAPINPELRTKWLSHLRSSWLEGLSVDSQFDWKIGSAIVFDSIQIHCSSDFTKYGVTSKLGLSIFTEVDE